MSVVRVHPDSVRDYGNRAQESFANVRAALETLVNDVVNVRYFGPNAIEFKTRCGELAADFANRLSHDLGAIADAVRISTSNIASALGDQPIVIAFNGSTIAPPPAPVGDGALDVDISALEQLRTPVRLHFETIDGQLADHLRRLEATDWEGAAKETAVSTVAEFTNAARAKVTEAQASITQYIDAQIDSVVTADR